MEVKVKLICIYPKDIQRITGKSERYGRLFLANIIVLMFITKYDYEPVDYFLTYCHLFPVSLPL
jgi:hypothetical protein